MPQDSLIKHEHSVQPLVSTLEMQTAEIREIIQRMRAERNDEELRSFIELDARYIEGRDYEVHYHSGRSGYLFAAWHGGELERGSDTLAELAAGTDHSLYTFKALWGATERHPLRVTSIRFNDSRLLDLARASAMVVSFHCCTTLDGYRIFVGGGAPDGIKNDLISHLRHHDFNAGPDRIFPGMHPCNPCNLGDTPGIQIEVTQRYMDRLMTQPASFQRLADAIRSYTVSLPRSAAHEPGLPYSS